MSPVRIAVSGASGRMGRSLLSLLDAGGPLTLAAALDHPDEAALEQGLDAAEVVVDFTAPDFTVALAERCAARGGPALVLGATGLDETHAAAVARAAERVAIVRSGNFSLGVNLLLGLVERAGRTLPAAVYDAEIFEAHHRRKVDAPSGTALMLGEAAARGRGADLAGIALRGRDGLTGPRPEGAIGFSVLRAGGIVGEHSVIFAAEDEIVTLSHSARDRSLFARGALAAAVWVAGRPPGLYDMQDVLGLRQ